MTKSNYIKVLRLLYELAGIFYAYWLKLFIRTEIKVQLDDGHKTLMLSANKRKILFLLNNFDLIPVSSHPKVVLYVRLIMLLKMHKIRKCVVKTSKREVEVQEKELKKKREMKILLRRRSSRLLLKKQSFKESKKEVDNFSNENFFSPNV